MNQSKTLIFGSDKVLLSDLLRIELSPFTSFAPHTGLFISKRILILPISYGNSFYGALSGILNISQLCIAEVGAFKVQRLIFFLLMFVRIRMMS
jgi:hypothetical protein